MEQAIKKMYFPEDMNVSIMKGNGFRNMLGRKIPRRTDISDDPICYFRGRC